MITKELFIETIASIEKQFVEDLRISGLFSEIFPNVYEANLLPSNEIIFESLMKILEFEMKDSSEWINYFIYELDFGKENYRLKVEDSNGNNIPMSTSNELYSFLIKNIEDAK